MVFVALWLALLTMPQRAVTVASAVCADRVAWRKLAPLARVVISAVTLVSHAVWEAGPMLSAVVTK
eukprot:COSAG01_NODE_24792_length_766_cov_1.196402_1_plen_65_part_10